MHETELTVVGAPKFNWFRAYMDGNLIMPQTYDAGAIFIARMVLKTNDLDALKKAVHLSKPQLSKLRQSMERVHQVRRIPAGNNHYVERARTDGRYEMSRAIIIDDEKLQYIWKRFLEKAVNIVEILSQIEDGSLLAKQLVAGFHTKECRSLLHEYRAQYDRRKNGSDEKALLLKQDILTYLINRITSQNQKELLKHLFLESK